MLNEFLEAANYLVSDGNKILWKCYGEYAYAISCESNFAAATVIFDRSTREVFEVTVYDKLDRNQQYRWRVRDYIKANNAEYTNRNLNPNKFADEGQNWADTDTYDDILIKVNAMLFNRTFNTDIVVEFNMSEIEQDIAEGIAAEKGLTFDEWFLENLKKLIEEKENVVD